MPYHLNTATSLQLPAISLQEKNKSFLLIMVFKTSVG